MTQKLAPGDTNYCEAGLFTKHYISLGFYCPTLLILQVGIGNNEFLRRILWTDEYLFGSDGNISRHNRYHYAEVNPHCRKEVHIWDTLYGKYYEYRPELEQPMKLCCRKCEKE